MTAHVAPTNQAPPAAPHAAIPPIAPAPATNRFTESWIPLERWCHLDGLSGPRRVSADAPPVYSVTGGSGVMTLRIGSQTAYWNGLEYLLGFAPQIIDGRPWVSTLDVQHNFEPLLSRPPGMVRSNRLLVIDPGHGGTDVGAQSVFNGHFEKEYTLDLARRLQPLLATNGWRVVLTRTDDSFLHLTQEGHYPKTLAELKPNYVSVLPILPPGMKLDYDSTNGTVKVVEQ